MTNFIFTTPEENETMTTLSGKEVDRASWEAIARWMTSEEGVNHVQSMRGRMIGGNAELPDKPTGIFGNGADDTGFWWDKLGKDD